MSQCYERFVESLESLIKNEYDPRTTSYQPRNIEAT